MKQLSEGFRYLIVGGLTTILNIAVYKALLILGSAYGIATTAAFIAGVLFAYAANSHFVFMKSMNVERLIKFVSARISTFVFETVGLIFCIELLNIGPFISKLLMTVFVVVLNYVLSKMWIFKGESYDSLDEKQ